MCRTLSQKIRAGEATYAEAVEYLCQFMEQDDAEAFRNTAIKRDAKVAPIFCAGYLFSTVRSDDMIARDNKLHSKLCSLFICDSMLHDGLPELDEWRLGKV